MNFPAPSMLAIGLLVAIGPQIAGAFDLQGTVWAEASKNTCKLDPRLLYAVALNESKRYAGKVVTPNPFALNISDKGYHPTSKAEAVELLSTGLNKTKSIAVGAMQVSVRWNGHRVNHPSDLLELRTNVFIGSEILCEMIKGQDDMALAIGRYYTPNPKLEHEARHYGENVLRIWRRLILLSEA
jgi:hypothetical protein